jgi:cytochrome c553
MRVSMVLAAMAVLTITGNPALAAGDATAGREKAAACKACHGAEGISSSQSIPNLAGQKETYLVNQLKAFRAGDRKNPLMAAIAGQLSDTDIANLAAFWTGLPAGGAMEKMAATANAVPTLLTNIPADFPKGFILYSTENSDGDGTVHLRYANAIAMEAARAGKTLPNGSILVSTVHKAVLGPDGKPQAGAEGKWKAGEVTSYSAMESRANWGAAVPELLRNGDWHYGLFTADKAPRPALNQAQCLACHKPEAANSYVFTLPLLNGNHP